MARESRPGQTRPGTGGIIVMAIALALVVLAVVGFLGGGFLAAVLFLIVMAVGVVAAVISSVRNRREGSDVVATARASGAPEPADYWGKVVSVTGTCPDGPTPAVGDTFIVSGGRVWPELCPHAREAILAEISRIADDEVSTAEPARVLDNDHQIMMEVHRAPQQEREAA